VTLALNKGENMNKNEKYFNSKLCAFGIYISPIFCLLLGFINLYISYVLKKTD
jgi:hypothetical protein